MADDPLEQGVAGSLGVSDVFIDQADALLGGEMLIYYASSDTRIHVATTTVAKMLDYVMHTPEDGGTSHTAAAQRINLIERNIAYAQASGNALLQRIVHHTTAPATIAPD